MRSVADTFRDEDRARLAALSASTRVALALALGARDLNAFRLAQRPVLARTAAALELDVVVGRSPWQQAIIAAAVDTIVEEESVPVVRPSGLVLLKLFAGGPQAAWDITQLLLGPDGAAIAAEVERSLDRLPAECRALWRRIRQAP